MSDVLRVQWTIIPGSAPEPCSQRAAEATDQDPRDWRRPRPIHARSETIDGKEPFRTPFHAGQRGIVIFRTFNEGEEVVKPSGRTETRQWTVDPRDGQPRGFAFVWRRFEISDLPAPMLACVQATVPANELIRRTIKSQEDDPRMPAILEDDAWSTWLGEGAEVGQVAVMLRSSCLLRQPMRCFLAADGRSASEEQRQPTLLTRQYFPQQFSES